MSFNGNEGEFVSLSVASEWTANYREANPGDVKAHFFGRDKLSEILAQPGCKGIRAYYAVDDSGTKQLVLVGADANEEDMTNDGKILDRSWPCPSNCATNSSLNS